MLNKIENINLKPDMRNEVKASKGEAGIGKVHRRENFSDTLTYSSALIFISSLNWKLRKFNILSDNLVELEIQYGNFSFLFLVNQKSPANKNIIVKISDFNVLAYPKVNKFILEVNFDYIKDNSVMMNYDVLSNIFSRVKTFYIPGESEINSTYYQNILLGLEEKLVVLLAQIYEKVLIFLEKLTNKKYVFSSDDSSSNYNNLTIKGIHVEYI